MKPRLLNKKSTSVHQSFIIHPHIFPQFYIIWHYHPELEILFFEEHSGMAFVGDKVLTFEKGTLLLFGSNLPHMLRPDVKNNTHPKDGLEECALHFPLHFLEQILRYIPEFQVLQNFLEKSARGICFRNLHSKPETKHLLKQILDSDNYDRMLYFLQLLKLLAQHTPYEFIASEGYTNSLNYTQGRLDTVYEYTMNNFNNSDITLEQMADLVAMNKTAFCRYFKKVTRKTYFQFLNEIRIGYACKILLEEEKKSIFEVAHLAGYNNTSNFNRQFRLIMKTSPSQYVRQRRNKVYVY